MSIIDLHQDILLHQNKPETYPDGFRDQTSFDQIEQSEIDVVVASGFAVPDDEDYFAAEANNILEAQLREYRQLCSWRENWRLITEEAGLQSVLEQNGQHGIIFHIESLNAFSGSTDQWRRLQTWYEQGWRSVGIVWNKTNNLGGGTQDPQTGLQPLGRELLQWAESKDMLIDFAHMNPPTFADALEVVDSPVIISHGNARPITDTRRNYSAGQIKAVAERNGVVGIFLSAANTAESAADVSDVVAHIDYLVSLVGIDHVAIGTDFGGLTGEPIDGLRQVTDLPKLLEALQDIGYTDDDIASICRDNTQRVLRSALS
jgi:membrane dipeptidase